MIQTGPDASVELAAASVPGVIKSAFGCASASAGGDAAIVDAGAVAAGVLINVRDCSSSCSSGNIALFVVDVTAGSEGDWALVEAISCDVDSGAAFAFEVDSKSLISTVVGAGSVDDDGAVVETAAMISMELSAGRQIGKAKGRGKQDLSRIPSPGFDPL